MQMSFQNTVVVVYSRVLPYLDQESAFNFLRTTRLLFENKLVHLLRKCSPDQKDAIRAICLSTKNCLIQGIPGVGKTYVIKIACDFLQWFGIKYSVLAPTGIAAQNVNGMTICRGFPDLFKLQNNWNPLMHQPRWLQTQEWFKIVPQVIFIDEISMVSPMQMEKIVFLCRLSGVRICVFGDFLQLQPIITEPFESRKHFFQNRWMGDFFSYRLTTNHRQNEADFIEFIKCLGKGDVSGAATQEFVKLRKRAYQTICQEEVNRIPHLFHKNVDVNQWNQSRFAKLPGTEITFHVTDVEIATHSNYKAKKSKRMIYAHSTTKSSLDCKEIKRRI